MDSTAGNSETRCGIVLAGGEGKRLQPFVQKLLGDSLPKQYGRQFFQRALGPTAISPEIFSQFSARGLSWKTV